MSQGMFTKGMTPWNKGTKGVMKSNSGSFKKGHIQPSKGSGTKFICEECNKIFISSVSHKRKYCSQKCSRLNTGIKISKGLTGRKLTKEHIEKVVKSLTGRVRTQKERKNLRLGAIKRIERQKLNGERLFPSIGKAEKPIIDFLQKCFNYKILRQYRVEGYFLDGYCPALNLAIEIDEEYHKNNKLKDEEREMNIKEKLNCQFLRIELVGECLCQT